MPCEGDGWGCAAQLNGLFEVVQVLEHAEFRTVQGEDDKGFGGIREDVGEFGVSYV